MSSNEQKSALNVVMVSNLSIRWLEFSSALILLLFQGAMTFGAPGKMGSRVHDIKDIEAILDVFRSHGHTEVRSIFFISHSFSIGDPIPCPCQIDTARLYAGGTSEEYLGKIDLASKGLKLETKLYPIGVTTSTTLVVSLARGD